MADSKASALTAASPLTGAEIVAGVQSTADRRLTAQAISDLAGIMTGIAYVNNSSTTMTYLGMLSSSAVSGTASASARTTSVQQAVNWVSAASTSSIAGLVAADKVNLLASGMVAQARHFVFNLPDGSYGSGSTGSRIFVGYSPAGLGNSVNSDNDALDGLLGLQYSTNRGDTNWQINAQSASGSANTTVTDTGIAFSTGTWVFSLITPRDRSGVIWKLRKLDNTAVGAGVVTTNVPVPTNGNVTLCLAVKTLSAVARNFRALGLYATEYP